MVDSINDDLIPYLPQMLLTLVLEKNFRITDVGIAKLPEWLETLSLPQNNKLSSHCIPKLPKTLRSLTFRTSDEILPGIAAEMPALTSLNVHGLQRLTGPTIAALPSSITNFLWNVDHPMGMMELTSLPRGLSELQIGTLDHPLESMPHIPPVKRLTIVSSTFGRTYLPLSHLPQTLLSLNLTFVREFEADTITIFPPTLTSLCLQNLRTAQFSDIERLPRGLHILKLPSCSSFKDEWFSALPPRLHVFHCTWNEEITDNLVKYAPRTLYRLVLRSMVIVDPAVFGWNMAPSSPSVSHPIDHCISIAPLFPRIQDSIRTNRGTAIHVPHWDTYSFSIDHGVLGVYDIFPRDFQRPDISNAASAAPNATGAAGEQVWYKALFSSIFS